MKLKTGYAVVWTGSGPRETYEIQSMHRTLEAAYTRRDKILRGIRSVPGQQNCGSFSRVFRVEDGQIV